MDIGFWFAVSVIGGVCLLAFFLGLTVGMSVGVDHEGSLDYGKLKAEEMRRERERILG